MDHLLQLVASNFPFACADLFIDELGILNRVARAEKQKAFAGQTVAARSSRFLIVAFDIFRQIIVDHEAHRSEEHTSELQSQSNLVCRLLLEKKNKHIK